MRLSAAVAVSTRYGAVGPDADSEARDASFVIDVFEPTEERPNGCRKQVERLECEERGKRLGGIRVGSADPNPKILQGILNDCGRACSSNAW
jgi:hypothetical protein